MSGVDVHAVRSGRPDAPTLVLSGSLGSDVSMWDPMLPGLEERYDVVRYDHRGHGRSPVPDGPYDIADLGADLLALLDRLAVDRAHLLGVSLGGMVGMWLAAHAPERLAGLVLCCTSARIGPPEMWVERAATATAEGAGALADAVLARWFTPGFAGDHPDVLARTRAVFADTPALGYARCCGAIERMDLRDLLERISVPTLVIAGTEDPATPVEHARVLVERIPDARLEVVPDAAHLAVVERPDAVTELVLEFLEPLDATEER